MWGYMYVHTYHYIYLYIHMNVVEGMYYAYVYMYCRCVSIIHTYVQSAWQIQLFIALATACPDSSALKCSHIG